MNKALVHSALAVVLGIAMTLLPTWLLLAEADQPSFSYADKLSSGRIPLLKQEETVGDSVLPLWPVIVGTGLIMASAIYVLVKRTGLNLRGRDSLTPS